MRGKELCDLGLLFYPNAFFGRDPDLMPVRGVVEGWLGTHELQADQFTVSPDGGQLICRDHVDVLYDRASDLYSLLHR